MGKIRGFLLKRRVRTVFRFFFRRSRSPVKPILSFFRWTRNLKSKVKIICCGPVKKLGRGAGQGYMQLGSEPDPVFVKKKPPPAVPKGYLAVYVGKKDGDFERVLVPVIYFNHPLFGELLREAEEEFGFDHPGAITIPCRISEFEHVQTRIKEGRVDRKFLTWNGNLQLDIR